MENLLEVRKLTKTYGKGNAITSALRGIDLDVCNGEFVSIMGPSGSGKTTLLNCISTIDSASSGNIILDGVDISHFSKKQLSKFRRDTLGFIFQDSNLVETLNGFENIALPLSLKGIDSLTIKKEVLRVSNEFHLNDILQKSPSEMSGGQRQRVATARAVIGNPKLILADEPTGALDSANSQNLLEILEILNRNYNATIVMVTHDIFAASYSNRTVFLKDGSIINNIEKHRISRQDFYQQITSIVSTLQG